MTTHLSDDVAQFDTSTIAFIAFSGAATALAGVAGLLGATAGVI